MSHPSRQPRPTLGLPSLAKGRVPKLLCGEQSPAKSHRQCGANAPRGMSFAAVLPATGGAPNLSKTVRPRCPSHAGEHGHVDGTHFGGHASRDRPQAFSAMEGRPCCAHDPHEFRRCVSVRVHPTPARTLLPEARRATAPSHSGATLRHTSLVSHAVGRYEAPGLTCVAHVRKGTLRIECKSAGYGGAAAPPELPRGGGEMGRRGGMSRHILPGRGRRELPAGVVSDSKG